MKQYKAVLNGAVIASNVGFADNFLKRLIGLLGHKILENGEALLIKNCKQIHTFGMKFLIDVIFLSKAGEILFIQENMGINKISKYIKNGYMVLELESGTVKKYNINLNSIIELEI
jgi:uncharacterized membrane protein (UPF0127 family)